MPRSSKPAPIRNATKQAERIDAEALGQVLREFRERTELTQERLGFKAGVAKNYVGDIEGARRNPTVRVVTRILDGLGISWAEFGSAYDRTRRAGRS